MYEAKVLDDTRRADINIDRGVFMRVRQTKRNQHVCMSYIVCFRVSSSTHRRYRRYPPLSRLSAYSREARGGTHGAVSIFAASASQLMSMNRGSPFPVFILEHGRASHTLPYSRIEAVKGRPTLMSTTCDPLAVNTLAAPWVPPRASIIYADDLERGGIVGSGDFEGNQVMERGLALHVYIAQSGS